MDFQAGLIGHTYCGHIRCDDSIYIFLLGGLDHLARDVEIMFVEQGIKCQASFDPGIMESGDDFLKIGHIERPSCSCAHVELGEAKINGISTTIDRCLQGGKAARGSKEFGFWKSAIYWFGHSACGLN